MTYCSTIKLNAGIDTNGNPRRVFVTFEAGFPVAAYDEGYLGDRAITLKHHRNAYAGTHLEVTVKEYKRWIKLQNAGTLRGQPKL